MTAKFPFSVLAVAALAASLPAPAGPVQPLVLRTVTMGGITAPAYYSTVERGYRFIGTVPVETDRPQLASLEASAR